MPSKPFLDIKLIGHRDVLGRFQRATNEVSRARRDEMRGLGRRVVQALRVEAPIKTGELRRKITFKTYDSGSRLELRLTSGAKHTNWVLYGRGPVVAKNAKALRFVIDGKVIYRKRVGPSRPNHFVRRAMAGLGNEPMRTASRMSSRIENAFTSR